MKWLLIVLLALTVSVSGCNKTGYECPTCEGEVAGGTPRCVHCGQGFDFLNVYPIALDPKRAERDQRMRDAMNGTSPQVPNPINSNRLDGVPVPSPVDVRGPRDGTPICP
jgi:hypothetical protein